MGASRALVLAFFVVAACGTEKKQQNTCQSNGECGEAAVCIKTKCFEAEGDDDGDGILNRDEQTAGTDPENADTDGDGIGDLEELGANWETEGPLDADGDGKPDAVEHATEDPDKDCLPDQNDPAEQDAGSEAAALKAQCALGKGGVCQSNQAEILAECVDGVLSCDFSPVTGYEAEEVTCDGLDNDCDFEDDEGFEVEGVPVGGTCSAADPCTGEVSSALVACSEDGTSSSCEVDITDKAQPEVCDGADNDCDGETDEDWESLGAECSVGVGACEETGAWACSEDGTTVVCDAEAREPTPEQCDDVDHDCDGDPLNGFEGLLDQPCTAGLGECQADGLTACGEEGDIVCVGETGEPQPEQCDELDHDCDGDPYNGFDVFESCTAGEGACEAFGTYFCNEEGTGTECSAVPFPPGDEGQWCNNIDDDCNGITDDPWFEQLGVSCAVEIEGCSITTGVTVCSQFQDGTTCAPVDPPEETCNGIDDDCNGVTDDPWLGQLSQVCTTGLGACKTEANLVCNAAGDGVECAATPLEPTDEICDGIDNDCNGLPDDPWLGQLGQFCAEDIGDGVCLQGLWACDVELGDAICQGDVHDVTAELCDALDNDCDGVINNDVAGCAFVYGIIRDAFTQLALAGATLQIVGVTAEGACNPDDVVATVTSQDTGLYEAFPPPGTYCVIVNAEGYETATTAPFELAEGEFISIDLNMNTVGGQQFATVCGVVSETVGGATSPSDMATLSLGGNEPGNIIGGVTTDGTGQYCFTNIPVEGFGGQYWITAKKLGFASVSAQAGVEFDLVANQTSFLDLELVGFESFSVCLDEDFEGEASADWEIVDDLPDDGVSWHILDNSLIINEALGQCLQLPPNEDCLPGTAGCVLCATPAETGCVPVPGAIARAWSGTHALWFGNPEASGVGLGGNFIGAGGTCNQGDGGSGANAVSASVASQPFQIPEGGTLFFRAWWEIESVDTPSFDIMTVELVEQVDGQDGASLFAVNLNPSTDVNGPSDWVYSSGGFNLAPVYNIYEYDVGSFAGQLVRLRFTFDSGDSAYNGMRGWLIDDVSVFTTTGECGGAP